MNDNLGFIKLYRKFLNWEWYNDINTSRLFLHLLFKANYKDLKFMNEEIKRGSLVTSYKTLSRETNLTIMQIRTSISKLKLTNEITYRKTNKYAVITPVAISGGVSIVNTADPTTVMDLCNNLFPGCSIRINADDTGEYIYSEDLIDDSYRNVLLSSYSDYSCSRISIRTEYSKPIRSSEIVFRL